MANVIEQPSQTSSDLFRRAQNGIMLGGKIMLLQTPMTTALNRVSVVCCFRDLSMAQSMKAIYRGEVDGLKKSSSIHFLKGVSGHLAKETSRLGFKTFGIMGKPSLDHHFHNQSFGKIKSDLLFASGLSLGEMLINPADTLRTMWQAGEKLSLIEKGKVLSHLYKGAGANGLRQFGTWLGFPPSERGWSKVVEKTTSIDSHSLSGIALKVIPQSFQITTPIWVFERLKNELQYHPNLNALEKRSSRYMAAFSHILRTQGWAGFCRGFLPKVGSNAILIGGADYLLEQGRKTQKV
jgi:hypothetical protein